MANATGRCAAGALIAAVPLLAGCPVTAPLPTQAPVRDGLAQQTRAKYFYYVPSTYDASRRWPLIVLCHGTNPYDTAWLQIREWAQYAEDHRIIVAAPELEGTRGDLPPPPDKQLQRQQRDERTILSVVAAMRAAYSIADERIFLTGWSGGGYAVLYTGLRNPDVFRALAVRQGNFDPRYLVDVVPRLDRWQPTLVYYGMSDLIRGQSEQAIAWLRAQGMYVDESRHPGIHRRLPVSIAWDFFREVYRNRPYIRISAVTPDYRRPREVRFGLRAIPQAVAAEWDFGDGHAGQGARVLHTYAADGTYHVGVKVRLAKGGTFRRQLVVVVPRPAASP